MQINKLLALCLALCLLLGGCAQAEVSPAPEPTPLPTAEPTEAPTPSPTAEPTPEPTATPSPEEVLLRSMTLEEKVAQLFFIRCPDVGAEELIETMQPGGVLLFARDFEGLTPEQVKDKTARYTALSKYGLLIGADEEGGDVVRVGKYPALRDRIYPSPQVLYAQGGLEAVLDAEEDKSLLLKGYGINVNFAPVCDVSTGGFMAGRSLGLPAEETAGVIREMVAVSEGNGVGCVLKHFPGYGNAADTHKGIVFDERSFDTFLTEDFIPFAAGMEAGAGCVLVSHSIVTCVDPDKPASLSKKWIGVLRQELQFDGVVITDDLVMDAIRHYTDEESAAVDAVLAGNDMLCCSDYDIQYPAVLRAVQSGIIPESRVDESVLRILRWKQQLGLI